MFLLGVATGAVGMLVAVVPSARSADVRFGALAAYGRFYTVVCRRPGRVPGLLLSVSFR